VADTFRRLIAAGIVKRCNCYLNYARILFW
jgi:DNA-binding Lrp family transcriptional regulator